jgi:hypothetical protein
LRVNVVELEGDDLARAGGIAQRQREVSHVGDPDMNRVALLAYEALGRPGLAGVGGLGRLHANLDAGRAAQACELVLG